MEIINPVNPAVEVQKSADILRARNAVNEWIIPASEMERFGIGMLEQAPIGPLDGFFDLVRQRYGTKVSFQWDEFKVFCSARFHIPNATQEDFLYLLMVLTGDYNFRNPLSYWGDEAGAFEMIVPEDYCPKGPPGAPAGESDPFSLPDVDPSTVAIVGGLAVLGLGTAALGGMKRRLSEA